MRPKARGRIHAESDQKLASIMEPHVPASMFRTSLTTRRRTAGHVSRFATCPLDTISCRLH